MQKRPGYSLGEGPMPTPRTLRGKREESAMVRLVVKYWPALPILLLIVMLRWRFQHAHDKVGVSMCVGLCFFGQGALGLLVGGNWTATSAVFLGVRLSGCTQT